MLQSSEQVSVRKAKPADGEALAGVFRESWEMTYRGIIPHLHLECMIRRRGADWWRSSIRSGEGTLILEVAGKVAGYATFGSARTRGPYQGELYELYLLPLYQGLGLGERMFEAVRHGLDSRGLKGLVVWALLANTPACDFYWRRGGRPVASTIDRIGGKRLEKVAFSWP